MVVMLACDWSAVVRLVQLCVHHLPSCVTADTQHSNDADTSRDDASRLSGVGGEASGVSVDVVSTCLLTSLRLLLNMTHDNS